VKNLNKIPELQTAIQSEIEAISTEVLTKFLNSFILRMHKVPHLWGHHMEHFLVDYNKEIPEVRRTICESFIILRASDFKRTFCIKEINTSIHYSPGFP
jgi:hypothetical protein